MTTEPSDPRDPLDLASDAPLLDGWLRFGAAVRDVTTTPFTIPARWRLAGGVLRSRKSFDPEEVDVAELVPGYHCGFSACRCGAARR